MKLPKTSSYRTLFLLLAFVISNTAWAKSNAINQFRVWDSPDVSRLIIDLKKTPKYEVFRLENPHRIVIDIQQTRLNGKNPQVKRTHKLIKNVRSAQRKNSARRIVIDTKGKIKYRTYALLPNREYGHRLVVELSGTGVAKTKKVTPANKTSVPPGSQSGNRDIIIAVDAGHGGEDPGALGRGGSKEKHIALRIAKKLKKVIDQQPGFRAVLTRKGDYYLSLRKRINIARDKRADMFISIHADAYKNPRVKGSSVFILSERGASDEAAKWLAHQENSADLVGGVSLDDKDKTLAMVLLDLSQTATIDASSRVARKVLGEIKKVGPVHNKTVQHARFVVLKSPDIPSLLVETAFISNPREEKRLNDTRYQAKLANAMLKGIQKYFKQNPPPNTLLAKNKVSQSWLVEPGDTLSTIAQAFRVSVSELRKRNQLKTDNIKAGQLLAIPF